MIRQLKIKFIATMMIILSLIFTAIIGGINTVSHVASEYQISSVLRIYADNDGILPDALDSGLVNSRAFDIMQCFSIKMDAGGQITEIINDFNLPIEEMDLDSFIGSALSMNTESGSFDSYRFYLQEKGYGKIIVFTDISILTDYSKRLLKIGVLGGIMGLLVLFIITLFLSNWMINPVKEAFEKQKQFVSDASHELKTPIAVINANADVLENEIGENKWLTYIKSESHRMSQLISGLLSLAKLEDSKQKYSFIEFNLSKAILSIALPFESTAFESKIDFQLSIEENITYKGQKEEIMQVAAILIDNAMKHTNDGGLIKVSLKQPSGKRILEVYNTGKGISRQEKNKIFERFYRVDEARSRDSESYGLGLSIAKSIVKNHKGKIDVQSEEGKWVRFTVTL